MCFVERRRGRKNRDGRRRRIGVVDQRRRGENVADQRFTFRQRERTVHLKRIRSRRRLGTNRSRLFVIQIVVQQIRRFAIRRRRQLSTDVLVGLGLDLGLIDRLHMS